MKECSGFGSLLSVARNDTSFPRFLAKIPDALQNYLSNFIHKNICREI